MTLGIPFYSHTTDLPAPLRLTRLCRNSCSGKKLDYDMKINKKKLIPCFQFEKEFIELLFRQNLT